MPVRPARLLERYCSGTALAATAVELLARQPARPSVLRRDVVDPAAMTGLRVARAAREGDPVAREAMAELARWLGEGLALIADVYDPKVVVLAGGVAASAPLFAGRGTGALRQGGHRGRTPAAGPYSHVTAR